MATVNVLADCGNSPKKSFIKQFNIASAEGDISFINDHVTEDVSWNKVGEDVISGKEGFQKALLEMRNSGAGTIEITHVLAHGEEGVARGEMKMEDGTTYSFCDVYGFERAKGVMFIKDMMSYLIKVEQ